MITDFFRNITGRNLSDEQKDLLKQIDGMGKIQSRINEKQIDLVSRQQASWKLGVPKDKNEDAFLDSYNQVNWVNNAVSTVAQSASIVPIKIFKRNADKKNREEVTSGLAWDIFQKPSDIRSWPEFQEEAIGFLLLSGNSYSSLDSKEETLLNMRPSNVLITASTIDIIKNYRFMNNDFSISQEIDPINIVHARNFNPAKNGVFYGISALCASWDAVNYNQREAEFQNIFWKEGGRLQGAFVAENEMGPAQIKSLKQQVKKNYRGTANMFRDLILANGLKYQQLGVSSSDQQILERRRMSTEDILAAFRVPPAMVGLLEFSNYSNVNAQERLFWMNAVMPPMNKFLYALNRNPLLSENGRLIFEHDYSMIPALREDPKTKADTGRTLVDSGVFTANEVRVDFWKKDPIEGGDVLKPVLQSTNPLLTLDADPVKKKDLNSTTGLLGPATYTEVQKDLIAKQFDEDLQENDKDVEEVTRDHLKDQKEQILKNIQRLNRETKGNPTEDDISKMLSGLQDEAEKYAKDLKKPFEKVIDKFGNREVRSLTSRVSKSISGVKTKISDEDRDRASKLLKPEFDFTDSKVQQYLIERPAGVAGVVDQKTVDDLRIAIGGAINDGKSHSEIAEIVENYFTNIESFRALRIARTETASAANFAIDRTYQQNRDALWGKQWVDSRDSLVRSSHIDETLQTQIGGEPIVRLDQLFILSSGAEGPRPSAFGIPAEDINCRCTLAPITQVDALDRGLITQEEFDEVVS